MFHGIDNIDDYVKDEKDTEDDCEKHKQDQGQEQGDRHDKGTKSNEEDTESNEEEKESNEEEKEGNGEGFEMKLPIPRNGSSASQLPQPIVTPLNPTAAKHMCKRKASFTPLVVR